MNKFIISAFIASLACVSMPSLAEESPVERYRSGTVSLMGGMNYTTGLSGNTSGTALFSADLREVVLDGLLIDEKIAVVSTPIGFSNRNQTNVAVGAGVGWVVPMASHLAFVPMVDFGTVIGTPVSNVSGTLGLDIFPGKNGFIEPYVSLGGMFGGNGASMGTFGAGYRLGVVF